MRKLFVLFVAIALTSCGVSTTSETESTVDSTSMTMVSMDSVSTSTSDTCVITPTDSVSN